MRIDTTLHPPSNPYHIARAYGVASPATAKTASASPVRQVPQAAAADPSADVRTPTVAERLIAATVPGGVAFDAGGSATATGGTLSMYRHPADKNAAATAVNVGRRLDVRG